MALKLNEVKQFATYDGIDKFTLGENAVNGVKIPSAVYQIIDNDNEVIDGQEVWLKVIYVDKSSPIRAAAREMGKFVYSDADNSVQRVTDSTISSSSGGGIVDWDQDADAVILYSIDPVQNHTIITHREGVARSGTDYICSDTSNYDQFSLKLVLTPSSPRSVLLLDFDTNFRLENSSATADDSRIDYRPAFYTNNGTLTPAGTDLLIGHTNWADPDTNADRYYNATDCIQFGQTATENDPQNANFGDWVVSLVCRPEYTDDVATCVFSKIRYKEFERVYQND